MRMIEFKADKLKDCPFCGEKPTFSVGSRHEYGGMWSNDVKLECCITMKEGFGNNQMHNRNKAAARETLIERWNERI